MTDKEMFEYLVNKVNLLDKNVIPEEIHPKWPCSSDADHSKYDSIAIFV